MSTDNTDRTAPQAPVTPDDVAPSSPTASTPAVRTPDTAPHPGEVAVSLADPADDAAMNGADEEETATADDKADTLNLREQASFPRAAGSQAAEAIRSTAVRAASAVTGATTNAAASTARAVADTADDAADDAADEIGGLSEEPTPSAHQEVHGGALPADYPTRAPSRPVASSPRPVVTQAVPTPSETLTPAEPPADDAVAETAVGAASEAGATSSEATGACGAVRSVLSVLTRSPYACTR